MGEVYRARDTKLGRDVAIKVLAQAFAADPARRSRFAREARLLAAFNHPHIGAIHGFEDDGDHPALILELVEGDTLAERLAARSKGDGHRAQGLPVSEALDIARQVADALDAAHERGIVHRDLKPANIKITPAGVVKLLDFGLGKAVEPPTSAHDLDQSPTLTADHTMVAVILGTAAYMSPEQARGQPSDKRADIWAFGCVLYEMLAGAKAFSGGTTSDIIAGVLRTEVDCRALPDTTPRRVRRLIERCLVKDRQLRLRDIGDARVELTDDDRSDVAVSTAAGSRSIVRPRLGALAATAGLLAGIALGYFLRPVRARPASASIRFAVPPPEGGSFSREVPSSFLELSPDGSQLAFGAAGSNSVPRIWIRSMTGFEARPVPGTENGRSPFWSPDGRTLAFFADGKLKRIDLAAGSPLPIADVPDTFRAQGSWGATGDIVYGTSDGSRIYLLPSAGGPPEVIVQPDASKQEARVSWPCFLPDGKRFVYLTRFKDDTGQLRVTERGGTPRPIVTAVSNVKWVDPDYLLFNHDGVLVAQRFDLASERLVGPPQSVAEPVDYHFTIGRALFTASRTGSVAYFPHTEVSRLVWFDRSGREIGQLGQAGGYQNIRISPDGSTVLFDRQQPGTGSWDLWTADLGRGIETRITSDRGAEVTAVWLRDGRGIVFGADRGGPPHLFQKDLTTGLVRELPFSGRHQQSNDVSPDGKTLVYAERDVDGSFDLYTQPLVGVGAPTPLVKSSFFEMDARMSPDGRAVSFVSNDTGPFEVYVMPFDGRGRKTTVSGGGADAPRWSRDGRELFYLAGNRVMAVPIKSTGPVIALGDPVPLFTLPPDARWSDYDISIDGRRFLAVVPQVRPNQMPLNLNVNWAGQGPDVPAS